MSIDGFYAGYFTGLSGSGMAMFILSSGVIVGADNAGVKFDGKYSKVDTGGFAGSVTVSAPPNVNLIQGVTSGAAGLTYAVPFEFSPDFVEEPFIKISTPMGPVNVKLVKLRGA